MSKNRSVTIWEVIIVGFAGIFVIMIVHVCCIWICATCRRIGRKKNLPSSSYTRESNITQSSICQQSSQDSGKCSNPSAELIYTRDHQKHSCSPEPKEKKKGRSFPGKDSMVPVKSVPRYPNISSMKINSERGAEKKDVKSQTPEEKGYSSKFQETMVPIKSSPRYMETPSMKINPACSVNKEKVKSPTQEPKNFRFQELMVPIITSPPRYEETTSMNDNRASVGEEEDEKGLTKGKKYFLSKFQEKMVPVKTSPRYAETTSMNTTNVSGVEEDKVYSPPQKQKSYPSKLQNLIVKFEPVK